MSQKAAIVNGRYGTKRRVAFLYWGRRGALTEFMHSLAREAMEMPDLEPTISVSRQNEAFGRFKQFGTALVPIDTYRSNFGAIGSFWRIPRARSQIRAFAVERQLDSAVTLMPHVWSPLITGVFHDIGTRYATVIHDGSRHPGDYRGLAERWTVRDAAGADIVFTLSETVRNRLIEELKMRREKIIPLFHPQLDFGRKASVRNRNPQRPLRLLFLGRIMRYKGLGLLVDSLKLLRARGIDFQLGVYGEGSIEPYQSTLKSFGAVVVNRWLSAEEVSAALATHDAVVLSHIEASQSGVAAAAFGAGLPVVATPVGGLREQVSEGETGVLSTAVEPKALADAIEKLATDVALYNRIAANVVATANSRSVRRFLELVLDSLGEVRAR